MKRLLSALLFSVCSSLVNLPISATGTDENSDYHIGYYRQPTVRGETIVFVAEGDLWKVDVSGGQAQRLTSHPGLESHPAISNDGRQVAFSAQYEGPTEAWVMPIDGGLPRRLTYFGRRAYVVGWTPQGEVLCATSHYSTLPARQLVKIDPATGNHSVIPLYQAADGSYDESGKTLFFCRFPFQGSYTKRYKGGAAQKLWKFVEGQPEAVELTGDYAGISNSPMWHDGRVYFSSDRDGTLNIWSMDGDGGSLRQETSHVGWDAKTPSLSGDRIVYQLGADIYLYNIAGKTSRKVPITLTSDLDQLRDKWVKDPLDYMTAAHLSHDGDRVVITARGDLFVVPRKGGRLVEATHHSLVRYRSGRFMPDGESLLALSDSTGELEFWRIPANGVGQPEQLTSNGTVFRYDGVPSPDGKLIAYTDKNHRLWIHDIERGISTLADSSDNFAHSGLTWSPDGRWLAFAKDAANFLGRICIYGIEDRGVIPVTTGRYLDHSPAWSPDGKWLYFLSNRDVSDVYPGVWTLNQPYPLIDKMTRIYMIPLIPAVRSPFEPDDELTSEDKNDDEKDDEEKAADVALDIDFDNIQQRVMEVPVPDGNYGSLQATGKQLLWLSWDAESNRKRTLQTIEIKSDDAEVKDLTEDVTSFEVSGDSKKILIRKDKALYIADLPASSSLDLGKSAVDLSNWTFFVVPAHEWHQMFIDAWRLERDYFYDTDMHGLDWEAIRDKYLPLVDRVTDRHELSDLLGEMVSELSSLHIYVTGGDRRSGPDNIGVASLGAVLTLDEPAGGYRVDHIYRTDPDEPQHLSPLARPGVDISEGDIITHVNGTPTVSEPAVEMLLRRMAGNQVLLTVETSDSPEPRDVIVKPISISRARDLRYRSWEYTRRLTVEQESGEEIGYVHLRATSSGDWGQWVRDFFPIWNRKGLIVDLRHNNGGNVDSWILTTLLRRPWAYWQPRLGQPWRNMQLSFNGHIAVLCNEWTVSDGELLTEGIRRLGLGKVIGTRTLGGEIWLTYSNTLVDRGIATAAEVGVYGPGGVWLIEGHGVEPDTVVDNMPHATFNGKDAQLEAAIEYLKEQIRVNPPPDPAHPGYPDKSFSPGQYEGLPGSD
ncbi:MAG: PD40 domain-containing protein [Candidatus Zixiibacteriota bacterium]|nr:MAG: PD40 domain-containing protein [candidate division Zixibacteria bacterium]